MRRKFNPQSPIFRAIRASQRARKCAVSSLDLQFALPRPFRALLIRRCSPDSIESLAASFLVPHALLLAADRLQALHPRGGFTLDAMLA
jgi:hypothetical protein